MSFGRKQNGVLVKKCLILQCHYHFMLGFNELKRLEEWKDGRKVEEPENRGELIFTFHVSRITSGVCSHLVRARIPSRKERKDGMNEGKIF